MTADQASGFHVSLYQVPSEQLNMYYPEITIDSTHTTVLRSVFMKPEHLAFIPELVKRLVAAI
jgi:hypothetical protein